MESVDRAFDRAFRTDVSINRTTRCLLRPQAVSHASPPLISPLPHQTVIGSTLLKADANYSSCICVVSIRLVTAICFFGVCTTIILKSVLLCVCCKHSRRLIETVMTES